MRGVGSSLVSPVSALILLALVMTLGILDMNSGGEVDKWSLTAVPVWGKAASLDPWIVGALAVRSV
jgi:hypothetical protein